MAKHVVTYSNGKTIIQERNGRLVSAQNTESVFSTMPKDVVEYTDDLDVPRNEDVGLKQTQPTEVPVYDYPYEMGDKGSDTSIVPRAEGDDGLGGEDVEFEVEVSLDATSGDPDNYVQKFQKGIKPTPAGNEANHAIASSDNTIKTAKDEELVELKQALDEERKLRQKAELNRERDQIARKIAYTEREKNLIVCASEADFEKRIAELCKEPKSILLRDLERVNNWQASADTTNRVSSLTSQASNRSYGSFEGGGTTLQTLGSAFNHLTSDLPTVGTSGIKNLSKMIQENLRLGKQFPSNDNE